MGVFRFRQFEVDDCGCGMKIGTDSVLLGAWAEVEGRMRILDMGCGSGVLALMCAQRMPDAGITAVDIDAGAVNAAAHNFARSPWAERLEAVHADILTRGDATRKSDIPVALFNPQAKFDMVICNPPYFNNGLLSPDGARATARHELNTDFGVASAIETASRLLSDGGVLAMVTPADCADEVIFTAEMCHLSPSRICEVHTTAAKPPKRILWQLGGESPCRHEELVIRNASGYTSEYVELTDEFYLYLH